MRTAVITGITGQDGRYLAQLLLAKGYRVYGISRDPKAGRFLGKLAQRVNVIGLDLADAPKVRSVIGELKPDELYNLAAQSSVRDSFTQPEPTVLINAMGALHLLEAVRLLSPKTRFYQASSSEMFGKTTEAPQREVTPFNPQSPYACSKVFAHTITQAYRRAYQLHCSCGILFNHESALRGSDFVTQKIALAAVRIASNEQKQLVLGNLDAKRDWGYAPEYVEAMWLMLQQEHPDDYVIATGETHSIREFTTEAFREVGIDLHWRGSGANEIAVDTQDNTIVKVDPELFRPAEVEIVVGDITKAKTMLHWEPKTTFRQIVRIMVDAAKKSPGDTVNL